MPYKPMHFLHDPDMKDEYEQANNELDQFLISEKHDHRGQQV